MAEQYRGNRLLPRFHAGLLPCWYWPYLKHFRIRGAFNQDSIDFVCGRLIVGCVLLEWGD